MQGDRHFAYDAAGKLVEERRGTGGRLVTRYEYDADHRLAAAHGPRGSTRYRYDAFGRRIAKLGARGETRFTWDGATLLGEADFAPDARADDAPTRQRWYVHEPGSFEPLACIERTSQPPASAPSPCLAARDGRTVEAAPAHAAEPAIYHYHLDHLGTPREMTDARGRIVWSARYRAFGALALADVDEVANPLRFPGQYHDAETGLHYNFQRYYDPTTGRFTTQDPIGLLGGDNLYRYVADPVQWIDPLGLSAKDCRTGFGNTAESMAAHPNYVGDLPFSYKPAPFQRFVQRFADEFSAAGFDDAQGFMQGSAASGVKHDSGAVLDARMGVLPSDYDVAVVSPKLAQRAQELGLNVFDGPLTANEVGALGLTDAQNALSAASKYQLPVNFKIYDSPQAAFDAQKTIPFSDWMK